MSLNRDSNFADLTQIGHLGLQSEHIKNKKKKMNKELIMELSKKVMENTFFIDDENIIWTKVRDIFVEEATGDKGEEDYPIRFVRIRNEANDIILENVERSINFDWVWLKELTPIDTNDSYYDTIEGIKETLGNIYDELREVI